MNQIKNKCMHWESNQVRKLSQIKLETVGQIELETLSRIESETVTSKKLTFLMAEFALEN